VQKRVRVMRDRHDGKGCALVDTAAKVRTERSRRWDHLRKLHQLRKCDTCGLQVQKSHHDSHTASCRL
jgi:hypothetical protein